MHKYSYYSAFKNRVDLKQYGSNSLTLFALQIYFDIDDITSIAADEIVDGPDDSGVDLIHIDTEQKFVVIAQTYESKNENKQSAKSNKAALLSQALTKLIQDPITKIPPILKSSAEQLRQALSKGDIHRFYIWYIHNLPSSINVKNELETVERTARSLLSKNQVKEIISEEISAEKLEEIYKSLSVSIQVNKDFTIQIPEGITIHGIKWESFVTSISGNWLYKQYKKYGTKLFSSNVRDYLGLKRNDKNINSKIQETALKDPNNFWVFNNGITVLVNNFIEIKKGKDISLQFNGFSILNGAQTTGAIGNLGSSPNNNLMIQTRFVKCSDNKTVINIKRYNNTQNKIEAPDFRSNDHIQTKLIEEFKKTTDIEYSPRRGGLYDNTKRKFNVLPSILTGQVLASFHGRPDIAYHQKTKIWEDDGLYIEYFKNAKAKHILLAYSLFEAIKNKKFTLVKKAKKISLLESEKEQLNFFQTRGSIFLLLSAISNCLEDILNQSIPNKYRLQFCKNFKLETSIKIWEPLINIACSFTQHLLKGFSEGAIREKESLNAMKEFKEYIVGLKVSNNKIYKVFAQNIEIK